jgi:hypothetical protein
MLEELQKGNFYTLVIGDENWFTRQFQDSAKWVASRDDVP